MATRYGASVRTIRTGQQVHDGQRFAPYAVDVFCRNTSGGNLTGAPAGSDWVEIDWANYVDGLPFPIKKLTASGSAANNACLGIVHWQAGTVADAARCWVRVFGEHPYAKVEGTTDVAVGDSLTPDTTAGQAIKAAAAPEDNHVIGQALAAQAADSVVATRVFLSNPSGLVLA